MPTGVSRDALCANVPVIVDGNCTMAGLTLLGGIYVWNGNTTNTPNALPASGGLLYVTDIQLAHTNTGQTIIVYTYTGTGTNPNRRTIIEEKRGTNQTIVTRQCLKTTGQLTDTGTCSTAGGTWYLDTSSTARNGTINQQVFTGVFSRNVGDGLAPTVTAPIDNHVLYVYNADVGQVRPRTACAAVPSPPRRALRRPRAPAGRRTATSPAWSTLPMPSTRTR